MEEQTNLSPEQSQEEQPAKHSVSDSLKELPMGSIIGSPLKKAAEEQKELAKSTEEFYKKIVFQEKKDQ